MPFTLQSGSQQVFPEVCLLSHFSARAQVFSLVWSPTTRVRLQLFIKQKTED